MAAGTASSPSYYNSLSIGPTEQDPTSWKHPGLWFQPNSLNLAKLSAVCIGQHKLQVLGGYPPVLNQDLPCTLHWGYVVPNSGYLGPNRGQEEGLGMQFAFLACASLGLVFRVTSP